jgi:DNA-binding MarR family transcriptional regulator
MVLPHAQECKPMSEDAAGSVETGAIWSKDVANRGQVMYLVHEVSRLISTYYDQAMARHNITRAQWTAMMHIYQYPGATQSELAEYMQMGRAGVGKMLERLERKNWIERRDDPKDQRIRRVYLHEQARPIQEILASEGLSLYNTFYEGMSQSQIDDLLGSLMTMRQNAINKLGKIG